MQKVTAKTNMDTDMSLDENVRNNNGFSRCPECRFVIPYQSLAEHMALKHKIVQSHVNFNDGIPVKPEPIEGTEMNDNKSGYLASDEGDNSTCDSLAAHASVSLSELIDITNEAKSASRGQVGKSDNFRVKNAICRSTVEVKYDNIFASAQNRPNLTAFELSGIGGSRSEFHDGQPAKTKRNDLARPVPVIPDNFQQCPRCSNIMHKDYLNKHIERKHKQDVKRLNALGSTAETVNGSSVELLPNANFVNCQFCSALMHIDYMAAHFVRKHKSENGAIGVTWDYNDKQFNDLLHRNLIYVKDGVLYVDISK